jgi:hypothetical protein
MDTVALSPSHLDDRITAAFADDIKSEDVKRPDRGSRGGFASREAAERPREPCIPLQSQPSRKPHC